MAQNPLLHLGLTDCETDSEATQQRQPPHTEGFLPGVGPGEQAFQN